MIIISRSLVPGSGLVQVLVMGAIHPERKQMWCYPFAAEGGTVVIGRALSTEGTTLDCEIGSALGTED